MRGAKAEPLIGDGSFLEIDRREIAWRRGRHNWLGVAYRWLSYAGRQLSPDRRPLEIDGETLRFAPCSWERRRDDPRLRRPAADGPRISAAHRRAPAPARFRSTVTRAGATRRRALVGFRLRAECSSQRRRERSREPLPVVPDAGGPAGRMSPFGSGELPTLPRTSTRLRPPPATTYVRRHGRRTSLRRARPAPHRPASRTASTCGCDRRTGCALPESSPA